MGRGWARRRPARRRGLRLPWPSTEHTRVLYELRWADRRCAFLNASSGCAAAAAIVGVDGMSALVRVAKVSDQVARRDASLVLARLALSPHTGTIASSTGVVEVLLEAAASLLIMSSSKLQRQDSRCLLLARTPGRRSSQRACQRACSCSPATSSRLSGYMRHTSSRCKSMIRTARRGGGV